MRRLLGEWQCWMVPRLGHLSPQAHPNWPAGPHYHSTLYLSTSMLNGQWVRTNALYSNTPMLKLYSSTPMLKHASLGEYQWKRSPVPKCTIEKAHHRRSISSTPVQKYISQGRYFCKNTLVQRINSCTGFFIIFNGMVLLVGSASNGTCSQARRCLLEWPTKPNATSSVQLKLLLSTWGEMLRWESVKSVWLLKMLTWLYCCISTSSNTRFTCDTAWDSTTE